MTDNKHSGDYIFILRDFVHLMNVTIRDFKWKKNLRWDLAHRFVIQKEESVKLGINNHKEECTSPEFYE